MRHRNGMLQFPFFESTQFKFNIMGNIFASRFRLMTRGTFHSLYKHDGNVFFFFCELCFTSSFVVVRYTQNPHAVYKFHFLEGIQFMVTNPTHEKAFRILTIYIIMCDDKTLDSLVIIPITENEKS